MKYKLSIIKYQLLILIATMFFVSPLRGQVIIGNNDATPRPFSLLELDKTYHTGGLRLPQLTIEQREALNLASDAGAAKGLVIYNVSTNCVEFWDGDQWESLCDGNGSIYLTDESNARISRNIEDPFLNRSETRSYTPHDVGCTTGTSFTVTIRLGGDYTHTGTPDAAGKFTLAMDDNPSSNPRLAILRVTDGCGYQDFLISQEGKTCIPPRTQPITDLTQTITPGSNVTMEVVADTGTEPLTYQWYWWTSDNVSSALPVGGAQDSIFSTTLSTAGTYYFWCKISNTCGTATSATFTVTVSCVPDLPSPIIGKIYLTPGAIVSYSVIRVPGVTYIWTLPAGWTQTGGGTTNSITATVGSSFAAGATAGTISVKAGNSCGESLESMLNVTVFRCGAYIATGVWKEFMCWNLGANEDADPFTPSPDINGDYYQWGYQYPSSTRDIVLGTPTTAGENTYDTWRNTTPPGDWSYPSITDPCPAGYRMPTQTEWQGVLDNNTQTSIGDWLDTAGYSITTAWAGSMFGNALFLPTAGNRNTGDGGLINRGFSGFYWSSTQNSATLAYAAILHSDTQYTYNSARAYGYSVRCIKDEPVEITGPEYISIPQTTIPQTYSVDVPGAASYDWHLPSGWTINSGIGTGTVTIFPGTAIKEGGTISVTVSLSGGGSETYTKEIKACGAMTAAGFKNFMCHNLGADETKPMEEGMTYNTAATPTTAASDDATVYGDLYQWGRVTDGHQKRDLNTTVDGPLNSSDLDVHGQVAGANIGKFVRLSSTTDPDWRDPQDNNLWNTGTENTPVKAYGDPCPAGWRVPTDNEWSSIVNGKKEIPSLPTTGKHTDSGNYWKWNDSGTAGWMVYPDGDDMGDVTLFLPAAGFRNPSSVNAIGSAASYGYYWSSATTGIQADYATFGNAIVELGGTRTSRAYGQSVRCIADELASACTTAPDQPGVISSSTGTGVVKDGVDVNYSISPVQGATNYTWTVPDTWKIAGSFNNSLTTTETTITVTPVIDLHTDGTVITVTANNACGISEPSVLGVSPCGAKVSSLEMRAFMCYNLDANYNADPFTPSRDLIGYYYQWGQAIPAATFDGIMGTWGSTYNSSNFYGNGNYGEITTDKSGTDPCPLGFRVPNQDEWQGVIDKNIKTDKGTWAVNDWSGSMFGDALFLPASGVRSFINGSLDYENYYGYYWGSTQDTDYAYCWYFGMNYEEYGGGNNRTEGYNIRCIANSSCIPPDQPGTITSSTGTGVVKNGVNVDYSISPVQGADSYTWIVPNGWGIVGRSSNIFTTTETTITVTPIIDLTTDGTVISVTANSGACSSEPSVLGVSSCGAKISSTEMKAFMCYNLGATKNEIPFTPSQDLNGDYYQWGQIVSAGGVNPGKNIIIDTWGSTYNPSNYYGNGNDDEVTTDKSGTDPCPEGYRVPNQDEWQGVCDNNTKTDYPVSEAWSEDDGWRGSTYGNALFLPAAGYRGSFNGSLSLRGYRGSYWSSTQASPSIPTSTTYAYNAYFGSDTFSYVVSSNRDYGMSIRCIAQ